MGLKMSVYRREFVVMLASAIAAGAAGVHARTAGRGLLALPRLTPDPAAPTFAVFYRLSQMVTGRIDLDREVARRMFDVFRDEPWAGKHLATAYTAAADALEEGGPDGTMADVLRAGVLQDGERWFVSHLLTTWYLGVYYHPDRPTVRITYRGALMHEAVADYRPVPGFAESETGAWAVRPLHLPETDATRR